ncbi:MAG: GDSL-type esterase/lipase family protein [Acidobacteriaceae bacterium]|nr:GDSL-type esterase/lipase family protein [Acidobacteriaceae bacterium]
MAPTPGPKILCPAPPQPTVASQPQGASVAFGAPSASGGIAPLSVSCTPVSGSTFPVGSTKVTCTASDAKQRTDACSFNVTVQPPTVIPTIQLTRFAAFGDSITWGEDGDPINLCGSNNNSTAPSGSLFISPGQLWQQVPQPYPSALQTSLRTRYLNQSSQIVVDDQGQPGEAPSDPSTLARFQSVVGGLSSLGLPYQAVLLAEGTNDIFYGDPTKIPGAIAGLTSMLSYARSRGVRAYLATVPPMVPGGARACGNHLVVPLNDQIRLLAAQSSVTLVDIYAGLGTSYQQYIGPDGLHLNQAGYVMVANLYFNVLTTTLESTSLVAPTTSLAAPTPASPRSSARPLP